MKNQEDFEIDYDSPPKCLLRDDYSDLAREIEANRRRQSAPKLTAWDYISFIAVLFLCWVIWQSCEVLDLYFKYQQALGQQ